MTCAVQRSCGGCPTLAHNREHEHRLKTKQVQDALSTAGLNDEVSMPIAGENRLQYRNRLRLNVVDGRATLFNSAKRDGCPALRPELWSAIVKLLELSGRKPQLLSEIEHLEVRVGDDNTSVGLSLACRHNNNDHGLQSTDHDTDLEPLASVLDSRWRVSCKASDAQQALQYTLAPELSLSVPLNAFVQVNSEVNRLLVSHVGDEVKRFQAASFIDLFSGAGNLCVPLLARGLTGHAVERSASAIAALGARRDAQRLTVVSAEVEATLRSLPPADVVLLNPPRSGVRKGYDGIAQLAKRSIVLVGCAPETLATDLAIFSSLGLKVDRIATFDMFPGTSHIETVATLVKQ